MSEQNLSAMTVIELRKLAKELHVTLSAGISKQGIIDRLNDAMGSADAGTAESSPAEVTVSEEKQETSEAVSPSETPVPSFRQAYTAPRFNTKPAYQAPAYASRAGAPRPPAAMEPQRTQITRPVGFTPRFGPAAQEPPTLPHEEERPLRAEAPRPAYQAPERRPAYTESPRFQPRPAYEQPARPAYEAKPAYEQPARPTYEPRPAQEAPVRPSYDQRPAVPAPAPAASEMLSPAECQDGSGILELHPDGYGFLRSEQMLPSTKDIYVAAAQVRRFSLRTGDQISGKVRPLRDGDKYAALLYVTSINGVTADQLATRPSFDDLTAIYPNRRINLETSGAEKQDDLRLVDLLAPIGFGQRALMQCPPATGKRRLMQRLANAISENHPDAVVMILLFNENPEDVTLLRDHVKCPVLATTFDMPPENHLRLADMAIEYAQRLAEMKRDVVILADSLTTLSRVCTTAAMQQGRQMPGMVGPASLQKAKRLFGAARCLREGGSLTVLAAMNADASNKVDEAITSEFRAAANMELVLDAATAAKGIYPPIDLTRTGTRRAELFVPRAQLESQKLIRSMVTELAPAAPVAELLSMLEKAPTNDDLFSRVRDWAAAMRK